jgi:thiamine pyrophosphokinase
LQVKKIGFAFIGGCHPSRDKTLLAVRSAGAKAGEVMLVAADSGLIAMEECGLTPDLIVGDMDSLHGYGDSTHSNSIIKKDESHRLKKYDDKIIKVYQREKDLLDTEIALNALWDSGCDYAFMIGGGGGRPDHFLALRALFDRAVFPRAWLTDSAETFCVDEGGDLRFRREINGIVSVLPCGGGPWKAESAGLKWPLDNVRVERGFIGVCNESVAPEVTIKAAAGRFLVILPFA